MTNLVRDATRWLSACAVMVLAAGWNNVSKADIAYAYAQQTITGLTMTGTGLSNGTMTGTASNASAVINGVGVATNNPWVRIRRPGKTRL